MNLITFGYKHRNPPKDADIIIDCRSLANPWAEPELRHSNGLDPTILAWIRANTSSRRFNNLCFIIEQMPQHSTIALGCYGGKHRSVAIAEFVKSIRPESTDVEHMDLERTNA